MAAPRAADSAAAGAGDSNRGYACASRPDPDNTAAAYFPFRRCYPISGPPLASCANGVFQRVFFHPAFVCARWGGEEATRIRG